MPSEVTNYQCPSCTGPLQFSPDSGKLECEYCSGSFTVAEVEAFYAEKNEKAQQAALQTNEWGEGAENMRAYQCPSCGAELICDVTTAATACPYCGNPSIVPGQFRDTRKPDYVLPFKMEKEEAVAALKRHYKGKLLLPKAFAQENHLQEIKGVYVPFWLYDGKAEVDAAFAATRSHVRTTRDERIITTEHFSVGRSGTVDFERVPVDGSAKMPDAHMDAIEPYDYGELKPFAMGYLPGFLADKFDMDSESCKERVQLRCRNSAIRAMENSVQGYDTCVTERSDVQLHLEQAKYALLPVWLLSTKWQDKNYLFAMNGQTGKFVGELPTSNVKFIAWLLGILLPVWLIASRFVEGFAAFVIGAFVAGVALAVMKTGMKTARKKYDADAYIPAVGVKITGKYDRFLRTTVSRQRIQNDKPPAGRKGPGGPGMGGPRGRGPGGR